MLSTLGQIKTESKRCMKKFLLKFQNSLSFNFFICYMQDNNCPVNFHTFCHHCRRAYLRLGELLCLKLSLFTHNCVLANSRWSKTACICRKTIVTQGKNNPFKQNHSKYYLKLTKFLDPFLVLKKIKNILKFYQFALV